MPRFKAALEDATLDELPRDEQCRDDLRAIKKIDGIPKLPKAKTQTKDAAGTGKKVQRHGDFAISLFLGHFALSTIRGYAFEFESLPDKSERFESEEVEGAGGW